MLGNGEPVIAQPAVQNLNSNKALDNRTMNVILVLLESQDVRDSRIFDRGAMP